jgi:hypothetical protein
MSDTTTNGDQDITTLDAATPSQFINLRVVAVLTDSNGVPLPDTDPLGVKVSDIVDESGAAAAPQFATPETLPQGSLVTLVKNSDGSYTIGVPGGASTSQVLEAALSVLPIPITLATTLTGAVHGGKTLVAGVGAQITVDWSQTGNGFACLVLNESGLPLVPALLGFDTPLPINGSGEIAIPSPGAASLLCILNADGVTKECWLVGDTVS